MFFVRSPVLWVTLAGTIKLTDLFIHAAQSDALTIVWSTVGAKEKPQEHLVGQVPWRGQIGVVAKGLMGFPNKTDHPCPTKYSWGYSPWHNVELPHPTIKQ